LFPIHEVKVEDLILNFSLSSE